MSKKPTNKPKKPKAKKTSGKYHLIVRLNDQVFEVDTDNIEESIKSFAPEFLKTNLAVTVSCGGITRERVLYGARAKQVFLNRFALEVLARNLTL